MASRPEHQCPPDLFYNATESAKYTSSSRIIQVQDEIARRAIELLALPPGKPALVLDVGCGSGLSGQALEEAGHVWVGTDVSQDMLDIASGQGSPAGDVMRHDMGLGLPFRRATFDGAVSVSALQWLCYSDSKKQTAKIRLRRFFSSLYAVLKRTARAALQFYPETPEQAVLIASAASSVGFTGGLVVDFPNSSKAKKYYLCLGFEHGYRAPRALGAAGAAAAAAEGPSTVATSSRDRRGGKGKGNAQSFKRAKRKQRKDREWVMVKKEQQRAKGKDVRPNTKFTARKRADKF